MQTWTPLRLKYEALLSRKQLIVRLSKLISSKKFSFDLTFQAYNLHSKRYSIYYNYLKFYFGDLPTYSIYL